MPFWKKFSFYFPRTLLTFAGLVAWVYGAAWALGLAFPRVAPLTLLLFSTVACALLASLGRVLLNRFFNI